MVCHGAKSCRISWHEYTLDCLGTTTCSGNHPCLLLSIRLALCLDSLHIPLCNNYNDESNAIKYISTNLQFCNTLYCVPFCCMAVIFKDHKDQNTIQALKTMTVTLNI